MNARFLSGQETTVIVGYNRTLEVRTFFRGTHGTGPSSRSRLPDILLSRGVRSAGFGPGWLREFTCKQRAHARPDTRRSCRCVCVCVRECVRRRLRNDAEPDANFQEFYKCEKVAQSRIVAPRSLRTEAFFPIHVLMFFFFPPSCRCHLQAVSARVELSSRDFISICFYKNPHVLVFFFFLRHFLLFWGFFFAFMGFLFAALAFKQSCWNCIYNHICAASVARSKRGQIGRAS